MIIRRDKHGLFIRSRWWSANKTAPAYRPGHFPGHSHAWETTRALLQEGMKLKTTHVDGAPFVRINMKGGRNVYWGSCGRDEGDYPEEK